MTQHVSIDLETLGKNPQAVIVSIAAVRFWPDTGVIGGGSDTFHRIIDLTKPGGGMMDVSTVLWWFNQPAAARDRLFVGPDMNITVPLAHALVELSEFLGIGEDGTPADVTVWQRGDKDAQWLTSAYEGVGLKVPFNFWQVHDQRTLCKYVPLQWPNREGVAHDALADAEYQAICLCRAFESLRNAVFPVGDGPHELAYT